jgi:hypothetical protein
MITTFVCCHCGNELPHNPRLKKKHLYCSAPECQQTRRSARKKERYQNDMVYRKPPSEEIYEAVKLASTLLLQIGCNSNSLGDFFDPSFWAVHTFSVY